MMEKVMQYESLFSEDAANSRYATATDSTVFPRLTRFPAFSSQAHLLETLDRNRGENPSRLPK